MKLSIFGPNLRDQSKGQFHVHTADCGDCKHYGPGGKFGGERGSMDVDAASALDVCAVIYADHLTDYGLTTVDCDEARELLGAWLADFWFAPCVKGLPTTAPSAPAVQEPVSQERLDEIAFDAYVDCGRNARAAARNLGCSSKTVRARVKRHAARLSAAKPPAEKVAPAPVEPAADEPLGLTWQEYAERYGPDSFPDGVDPHALVPAQWIADGTLPDDHPVADPNADLFGYEFVGFDGRHFLVTGTAVQPTYVSVLIDGKERSCRSAALMRQAKYGLWSAA